jgi:hypothetical protein
LTQECIFCSYSIQEGDVVHLMLKTKFKPTHHSELYSWKKQNVLSPMRELSLCEIFDSSLTWASQHTFITQRYQYIMHMKEKEMIMTLTFVQIHLVGIQGPIQNQQGLWHVQFFPACGEEVSSTVQ